MRRFLRGIIFTSAGLSLLLCLATCVEWARSYWAEDGLGFDHTDGAIYDVYFDNSLMYFDMIGTFPHEKYWVHPWQRPPTWDLYNEQITQETALRVWNFCGVEYARSKAYIAKPRCNNLASNSVTLYPILCDSLWIPYWLPAVFFLILPLLTFVPGLVVRLRLRRRRQRGLCLNCGYDLRATPDRCPECGTVPLPSAKDRVCHG
jgi:hypothetical protein